MIHQRQAFLAVLALISSSPIGCASSSSSSKTHDPVGGTLSREDEIRATLNKPPKGSHVLATDPKQTVASVLNQHLHQAMSPDKIRPCDSFDIEELNDVLAALLEVSHPSLQEMYLSKRCDDDASANARCDKRSMRHPQGIDGYREEWQDEMDMLHAISDDSVKAVVESVLRKGKCFEAVQLYYHHLSEESRQQFQPELPLLPDNQDDIKILARLNQQIQGMTKHEESHAAVDAHGDYVHSDHDHHQHQHRWLKEIATGNSNNTDDAGNDDVDNTIYYQDDVHTNTFSQETYNAKLKFLSAALGPGSGFENTLADLMAKYNTQSPCAMSHRVIAKPWTIESAEEAGVSAEVATFIAAQLQNDTFNTGGVPSKDYPDTAIPGAGYIPCDQADVCLEGGDRKYMIQAAVRSYVVPGSAKIQKSNSVTPNTVDYAFHTRTFEGMAESPSKFGPDAAGGDGTLGLLGPAIVANPGERVHIFVKNNLADTSALGPNVPTPLDFWKRIQVIRNITNTTRYFLNVSYNGPEWPDDEYPFEGTKPLPPDEMMPIAGLENVPGETTDGYDVFNIHMHGWEVAPHLFDPQGTSNPAADWISVSPDETSGRQCYCYRHTISETQSRGDYLYHTHRHGTTTELTWGGMFGLSLTGEESVEEARTNASSAATLNRDLVAIADAEGLAYNDSDVNIMVIYDSVWSLSNITNENNETSVVVTDFISGFRSTTGLHPYFVNNEYQPTFKARTGALSVFRLACVSAGNLCAFIILEGTNKTENSTIIPFDRVASDGISYNKPIHREGNGNPLIPDLTNTEAYLSMGGGMREVVVAQFPRAGTYQIWMLSNAFDDGNEQLLATVDVTGADAEIKDITGYTLKSARPSIESRPVDEYRGMTFKTNYDQEAYPFPMYGIGDVNGENASAYNLTEFDIGAKGRTCGIWVIRSMDIVLHPFHIHVNPFMILSQKSHWDDNPDLQLFISDYTLPFDVDKGTALTGIWRDTAIVPPYGYLVIKQCYDAGVRPSLGEDVSTFAGKFVFHCHFLVHEDTGLIRNIILASNSSTAPTSGASSVVPMHLVTTSMFLAAFVLWFL